MYDGPLSFEQWVVIDWPEGVPTDCTQISECGNDCVDRLLNISEECAFCREYGRRLSEYYSSDECTALPT